MVMSLVLVASLPVQTAIAIILHRAEFTNVNYGYFLCCHYMNMHSIHFHSIRHTIHPVSRYCPINIDEYLILLKPLTHAQLPIL